MLDGWLDGWITFLHYIRIDKRNDNDNNVDDGDGDDDDDKSTILHKSHRMKI